MLSWLISREEWLEIYGFIKKTIPELSYHLDQYSTDLLSEKLRVLNNKISIESFFSRITGRELGIVVGCSEQLYRDLHSLKSLRFLDKSIIVSADGATRPLLEAGIVPHLVVTDLDGDIDFLLEASRLGSIALIHAHGDNFDKISKYTGLFKGPVIGSTQVEPRPYVHNFGGFTDGDRAVYVLYHAGYRDIILVGFNLDEPSFCPGKTPVNLEKKRLKLIVAKYIMSRLRDKGVNFQHIGDIVERPCS